MTQLGQSSEVAREFCKDKNAHGVYIATCGTGFEFDSEDQKDAFDAAMKARGEALVQAEGWTTWLGRFKSFLPWRRRSESREERPYLRSFAEADWIKVPAGGMPSHGGQTPILPAELPLPASSGFITRFLAYVQTLMRRCWAEIKQRRHSDRPRFTTADGGPAYLVLPFDASTDHLPDSEKPDFELGAFHAGIERVQYVGSARYFFAQPGTVNHPSRTVQPKAKVVTQIVGPVVGRPVRATVLVEPLKAMVDKAMLASTRDGAVARKFFIRDLLPRLWPSSLSWRAESDYIFWPSGPGVRRGGKSRNRSWERQLFINCLLGKADADENVSIIPFSSRVELTIRLYGSSRSSIRQHNLARTIA